MVGLRAKLALGLVVFVLAALLVLKIAVGFLRLAFWAVLVLVALAFLAGAWRKMRK